MCSVNEVEDELIPKETEKSPESIKFCMKCGSNAVVLVRAKDPLCRSCFIGYFVHKFRATLGKSKAIRQGEKVLVAFSGGPSSCCLLHLIKEGLSAGAHKKLRFVPEILFINEGSILNWPEEKIEQTNKEVSNFASTIGFGIDTVSLEKLYKDSSSNVGVREDKEERQNEGQAEARCSDGVCHAGSTHSEPRVTSQLKQSFAALKSLTAKQDFLVSLRSRFLRDYAKMKQCSKIIVAETSTQLSIKLLLNISQGRGASLPLDVGVTDSRDNQVTVIRPMRELTTKEVAFYNRMHDIEPVVSESLDTLEPCNSSLQKQTEAFVTNLQTSFPSTVSTVFRTGDKLSISDDLMSSEDHCIMCQAPVSEGESSIDNIAIATEKVSLDGCCGKGDGSCQKPLTESIRLTKEDVITKLCYGCRLTFKDMGNDVNHLPPFVFEEFKSDLRRFPSRQIVAVLEAHCTQNNPLDVGFC